MVLRSRLRSSFRCSPFRYRSVRFPQIGEVKAIFHRIFTGEDEVCHRLQPQTGKRFVSLPVDDGKPDPEPAPFSPDTTPGIDLGLKDFAATLSSGEKIENPRYLKYSLQRLKVLQRRVSRKTKGSKNRKKAIQRGRQPARTVRSIITSAIATRQSMPKNVPLHLHEQNLIGELSGAERAVLSSLWTCLSGRSPAMKGGVVDFTVFPAGRLTRRIQERAYLSVSTAIYIESSVLV
ncbi:MAG: transposase [Candidatus Methanoculleus thermohydrogenotrophicum]